MPKQGDDRAYLKLAQLLATSDTQSILSEKYAEHVLHKKADINFQISADTFLGSTEPELQGCTVLHLAYKEKKLKLFNLLLSHGVDFNIKNQRGDTVLHQIIQDAYEKEADLEVISDNLFVTSVLDALVMLGNSCNPCNKKGITNFHIACMANHKAAIELFLKNKVPLNQSVAEDSSMFPGYTAVHFAARFSNSDVVKTLLQSGAAPNIKNAEGVTPLHMLIKQNIEMTDLLNKHKVVNAKHQTSQRNINEEITCLLLNKCTRQSDVLDDTNLTRLHVACVIESLQITEDILGNTEYINQAINSRSSLFAGNTALHFAALCNVEKVKLLLKKGASIHLINAKKQTAFELCVERYKIKDIYEIIATQPDWSKVEIGVPGKTLLDLIACLGTGNLSTLPSSRTSIGGCISNKSPIWSTYYLLHLAVIFSERACKSNKMVVEKVVEEGSTPINRFTIRGVSPLHLAFRLKKAKVVDFLLRSCRNSGINYADIDKLSHLHVACTAGVTDAVESLLFGGARVNDSVQASFWWYRNGDVSREVFIPKGATPLHIAVIVGHVETMELLVDHGADIYAQDKYGMTPIHWLIASDNPILPAADILLTPRGISTTSSTNSNKRFATISVLEECITSTGLSHLHVACFADNAIAVEQLLDLGSNVNARSLCTVDDDSKRFPGKVRYASYTPLHFALETKNEKAVNLLIRRGADVLMKNPIANSIPMFEAFNDKWSPCSAAFISLFKRDKELQHQVEKYSGLTMLHFCCCLLDDMTAEDLLTDGAVGVNRSMLASSPIWPGFTPLHVLMKFYQDSSRGADDLLHLLLDHGADVTALDAQGDTPLHLAYHRNLKTRSKVSLLKTLLRSQRNFHINPRNTGGLSHFHIACVLGDVGGMEKLLKPNFDVNQPIDYFYENRMNSEFNGCTPLHLVLYHPLNQNVEVTVRKKAVTLLIQHSADVSAENVLGNTPLHVAAKYHPTCVNILKKITEAGGDIYATNLLGQTSFEIMLRSGDATVAGIKIFLDRGYCTNAFNPITHKGFLAMILSSNSYFEQQRPLFELMMKSCRNTFDKMHRTIFHNIVSTSSPAVSVKLYTQIIESLVEIVDIDHQDDQGKTALHLATQFKNHEVVFALLQAGADINIIDAEQKTAFAYAFETLPFYEGSHDNSEKIVGIFSLHVKKLQFCEFEVHEMNHSSLIEAFKKCNPYMDVSKHFYEELAKMKNVKIGSGPLTLLDFVSGTNTQIISSYILKSDRNLVNSLFDTISKTRFYESLGIIKLHCRKIVKIIQRCSLKEYKEHV